MPVLGAAAALANQYLISASNIIETPRTFRCGVIYFCRKKRRAKETLKNSILSDATHTFVPPHTIPARYLLSHTTKVNKIPE